MSTFVASPEICHLLEYDYYLKKVLEMLVDDGVHIYRLVCRRWKGICGQLPLKIKSSSMEDLPLLVERFTRIRTLTLSCHSSLVDSMPLTNLNHLRHLQLFLSTQNWQFSGALQMSLHLMSELRSLSLRIRSGEVLRSLIPTLRSMTQLTSLEVKLQKEIEILDVDPLSELQRIKELKLSISLLINNAGELLFPKMLHLTKLETFTHMCGCERISIPLIDVIYPCAWNLRALRLGYSNVLSFTDASHLINFPKLESLRLDDVHCRDSDLGTVLRQMDSLTALDIHKARGNVEPLSKALFYMTTLKSLTFSTIQSPAPRIEPPSSFASWTQLRRLHLSDLQFQSNLHCPAGLTELRIESARDLPLNLSGCLGQMTGLVSLAIANGGGRYCLPSQTFSEMRSLQALALEQVEVDGQFFATLADLPELTELKMVNYGHVLDRPEFRCQLNRLTGLRVLDFRCGKSGASPLEYLFEGGLMRLKDLTCSCDERDSVDQRELYRRFPCLHRLDLKSNLDDIEFEI